ncbi:MAG: ribosome recycling factor [Fidelibacterota bacterium]
MMQNVKEYYEDAKQRMESAVEHCRHELAMIRTGRASPALLDGVKVPYYGAPTPLKSLANIMVQEARLLVVQPYDKNLMYDIERSIQAADLGLNPTNDGTVIRLPIPPLTEERRHELVKIVHNLVEESRITVRNVRKDVNNQLRELERSHEISEDGSRIAHEEVQKTTDDTMEILNRLLAEKEKEILEE